MGLFRTPCSKCTRLFNYPGGGITCDECKALKVKESEMKEYLSTCARCLKQCHALELTKGVCKTCVQRRSFVVDRTVRVDDTKVDIVQKHCSACASRWNFIRGEEKSHCPNCGVSYTETVRSQQEERNKANKAAFDYVKLNLRIKELRDEVTTAARELERKQDVLNSLILLRKMQS